MSEKRAFPMVLPRGIFGFGGSYQPGMDLRDWFAGLIAQKLIKWDADIEVTCRLSYKVADEMVKVREDK